jgi:hypothetical protein
MKTDFLKTKRAVLISFLITFLFIVFQSNNGFSQNAVNNNDLVYEWNEKTEGVLPPNDKIELSKTSASAVSDGPITYAATAGTNSVALGTNCSGVFSTTICIGTATSIYFCVPTPGTASFKYQIDALTPVAVTPNTATSALSAGLAAGAHTIVISTYRALTGALVETSNPFTFTVKALNTAIVGTPNPVTAICQGGTSVALGGSYGGGATAAVWSAPSGSFSNNTGSTPGTATYTATPGSTTPITLTLTATGTCPAVAATKTITVNPNPTVAVGGAMAAICQGTTSAALGGSFGGGATSAVWSSNGGGSFTNNTGSTPGTATFTAAANSTTPIRLTLTTGGGSCLTTSNFKDIVVNVRPVPTPGSAINQCGSASIPMTGASATGTYSAATWTGGAGNGTWTNNANPGLASFLPSTAFGSFTATLTLTGSGGCTGVNPPLTRVITWTATSVAPTIQTITPH